MISEFVSHFFAKIPKGDTYLGEAEFGLKYIEKELQGLVPESKVLEVGSGPCILLNEISTKYKTLDIQGIEPMGEGFYFFSEFQSLIRAKNPELKVFLGGYESFSSDKKWDLIFLVNVFEHLPNWQHFLEFAKKHLSKKGKCIILCPNYGFPYESHFRIPIFINKAITGFLFKRYIRKLENSENCLGLWASLNFVTYSKVKNAAGALGLKLISDEKIVRDMVDRLSTDVQFANRQSVLRWPAQFMNKIGALDWLIKRTFFHKFLPYMYLEISLPESGNVSSIH